jgi:glycosyltransferase involved in cell wall biosynthesis
MSPLDCILVIIPVRNEESTIVTVIKSLQTLGLNQIRVVDNGSTDASAAQAQEAGAEVIFEPIPGYGRACWRGLQQLPAEIEWILFCDGDGSDDLSQLPEFLAQRDNFDLIIGARNATAAGRRAMTPVQKFGNRLASLLINWGWGYQYHDLGPLRLIRRSALEKIQMQDRGMGWTVEMQVRAVECNLRICELPVSYRYRQGGKSKISGTVTGSIKAGMVIMGTIASLFLRRQLNQKKTNFSLLLCFSSLLLMLGSVAILPYGDFRQLGVVSHFWVGISIMSVGFILSWRLNSIPGTWFWGVALLTRLLLLGMYPGDDIWRYLWEGYIQTEGFSPYHFAPDAAELEAYRTLWWSQINHHHVSAIYPPIAQFGFRALAAITPKVILFKSAFVLADLLICGLLVRIVGWQKATFYGWNPLVIYSFAGGGHYDSWFILPLVAAWIVFDNSRQNWRWFASALLVGMSMAIKWISLPILGFLAWRAFREANFKLAHRSINQEGTFENWSKPSDKRTVAFCLSFDFRGAILALLVLIGGILPLTIAAIPFCHAGECPLIPLSSDFVTHGRSAELFPYLLALVWQGAGDANWYYLFPLGLAVLWLLYQARTFQQFAQDYFFALLIISPIIHAWYFTWCIPFAVVTQNLGVRLVSISSFVYFALWYRKALGITDWYLTLGERMFLWFPFLLGWLWTRFSEQTN